MKKLFGFTLIELMAVMAIAGLMLVLAVPAMRTYAEKSKMVYVTNELVSTIQVSRSEAIRTAGITCVCPSLDPAAVAPSCSGTGLADGKWLDGWIAFTDSAGDCVFDAGAVVPDTVIRAVTNESFGSAFALAPIGITNDNYLRFTSRGIPQKVNGTSQSGMFVICDERGGVLDDSGKAVPIGLTLSAAGSLRNTRDPNVVPLVWCD